LATQNVIDVDALDRQQSIFGMLRAAAAETHVDLGAVDNQGR